MPITLQTFNNGRGVRTTYSGIVTDNEYLDHIRLYPSLPDEVFARIQYGLTDLTSVEKLDLSTKTVIDAGNVSAETMKKNPSLRIAIAAPHDLAFGMSSVWSAWSDMDLEHTALFRTVNEAKAWLADQVQSLHSAEISLDDPDPRPAFRLR